MSSFFNEDENVAGWLKNTFFQLFVRYTRQHKNGQFYGDEKNESHLFDSFPIISHNMI